MADIRVKDRYKDLAGKNGWIIEISDPLSGLEGNECAAVVERMRPENGSDISIIHPFFPARSLYLSFTRMSAIHFPFFYVLRKKHNFTCISLFHVLFG